MNRKRKRYQAGAGGIDKIYSAVQDNLARLVLEHGYHPTPNMMWLGECAIGAVDASWDFTELEVVFKSFSEHMEVVRGNDADYIAKRMRDLKPAMEWSMMQQWYWDEDYQQLWSVPERDIMKTKEFMDNLCRQLNTEGDLVAKTKREVKKLCPSSLSLEEFKTRLSAHHMRVLEDVDSQLSDGGDRGISVEMSLHDKTAEQLMGLLAMESVAYGGRANDTHRLIWVGDDAFSTSIAIY